MPLAIGQGQPADAKPANEGQKPNILFIMSDDHTCQAIGAYGDPRFTGLEITPSVDGQAEYCPQPFRKGFASDSLLVCSERLNRPHRI